METIEIRDFAVSAGEYQRVMWRMYFGRNWWWMVLPLVLCAVLAAVMADVRWLLAGLMLLFMVFPMLLVLVYIRYALTLEVRWSLMEKTAVMDREGIHLTFTDARMKPRTIAWGEVSAVTRDSQAMCFHLRVRRYNFLMLPIETLVGQQVDVEALLALMRKGIDGK